MSHSVTLELPDPLYQKLKVRSQQANRSVEDELLTAFAVALPVPPSSETAAVRAYEEVTDFLISGPSPIQMNESVHFSPFTRIGNCQGQLPL
ncbi:MAG TPA: hypothetical protein P5121_23210 [Caldilineaceae bacterium]|mgnify:CR=1 FL=1|nr:hypothetical protein [Caldilineaceae bacterium]